jgi:hypothetical protein
VASDGFRDREITYRATTSGTYYVEVEGGDKETTGAYTLRSNRTGSSGGGGLSPFVRRYDRNDDGKISLTELGRAATDFANDDITLVQLGEVSTAFANT